MRKPSNNYEIKNKGHRYSNETREMRSIPNEFRFTMDMLDALCWSCEFSEISNVIEFQRFEIKLCGFCEAEMGNQKWFLSEMIKKHYNRDQYEGIQLTRYRGDNELCLICRRAEGNRVNHYKEWFYRLCFKCDDLPQLDRRFVDEEISDIYKQGLILKGLSEEDKNEIIEGWERARVSNIDEKNNSDCFEGIVWEKK